MRYRYAVYFVPKQDSLFHSLGSALLGYDNYTGQGLNSPELSLPKELCLVNITEEPRRYGLHATVLAPFFLDKINEAELLQAARRFCTTATALSLPKIELVSHRGFLAIRPARTSQSEREAYEKLQALAARALLFFFPLAQTLDAAEISRRLKPDLSPRQQQYLHAWGYPYLFEDYDFHITLTNALKESSAELVKPVLSDYFEAVLTQPCAIDTLCICRQPVSKEHKAGDKYTGAFTVQECFSLASEKK